LLADALLAVGLLHLLPERLLHLLAERLLLARALLLPELLRGRRARTLLALLALELAVLLSLLAHLRGRAHAGATFHQWLVAWCAGP